MDSGVYQIYNPISNKRYIGSSVNVYRRLKEHRRNLKNNNHCNTYLQNAWNKYKYLLIFEIIELCDIQYIRQCEKMYIDHYDSSNRKLGYNIDIETFENPTKLSEETKRKLSVAHLGKIIPRDIVEKIRILNTGQKRPTHSENMSNRWSATKEYFGWDKLSNSSRLAASEKLSKSTTARFSDFRNKSGNIFIKCIVNDETLYFHGYKDAGRYLNIDKGSIRYAFKYSNGIVYKIHAKFEKIDMDEYMKNKVTGER